MNSVSVIDLVELIAEETKEPLSLALEVDKLQKVCLQSKKC